jgi:tetratricopeptide (TPR) repeat protein
VNCRVFALASLNEISEAETLLRSLSKDTDERQLLVAKANQGLIAFRKGNLEEAKQLYNEAIQGFYRQNDMFSHTSAQLYLAREAILANVAEAADLFSKAKKAVEKLNFAALRRNLEQVERVMAERTKVGSYSPAAVH